MKAYCSPIPSNKKEYISDIGKILINDNGKKKYYKPEEVKEAHRKSKWYNDIDFSCWAMNIFSSHTDFKVYHKKIGKTCNYIEMKSEMLNGLSTSSNNVDSDWINLSGIDPSWLDFGEAFEGILEGIGEFIGSIFDGA